MSRLTPRRLAYCGLFAALCAVLTQIAVPVAEPAVTLTHVALFMAAGLLGPWYGALSVIVYVLLGAAGLPVFTRMEGGLGKVFGPGGGFIFGYIPTVLVTGLIIERRGMKTPALVLAMLAGWLCTYGFGLSWMMVSLRLTLPQVVVGNLLPYLPGDVAKTALCAVLLRRLAPLRARFGNGQ